MAGTRSRGGSTRGRPGGPVMLGEAARTKEVEAQFDEPMRGSGCPWETGRTSGRIIDELDEDARRAWRGSAGTTSAMPRSGTTGVTGSRTHAFDALGITPSGGNESPRAGASRPSRPWRRHRRVGFLSPTTAEQVSPAGSRRVRRRRRPQRAGPRRRAGGTTALAIVFSAALGRSLGRRTSEPTTSSRPWPRSPTCSRNGASPSS